MQILATEIYKTINNIFTPKTNAKIRPHDTIARHHNTATYGDKSLTALGPKIWNKLSANIKSLTSITKFKEYTRMLSGPGPNCKCNVKYLNNVFIYLFIYLFLTVLILL